MGIVSAEACQQRSHQPAESYQRIPPECAEQQVEPNYIRLHAPQHPDQAQDASRVVEGPATHDRKSLRLDVLPGEFVRQHGEIEKRITLQFLRNVKSIFAQPPGARRKCRN